MAVEFRKHLFRGLDRVFIKPVFSPRMPPWLKRRWINAFSTVNLTPRGTRIAALDMDGVPAERVTVGEAGDGVVLYLHGGGYVFGSPATHRSITAHLARDAAATVYAPDYRLAPESPFPAALEDATRAYRWLLDQGIATERIVIAGDSAGGGLALATALSLRDAGTPLPAGLLVIAPWVDLTGSGESVHRIGRSDPMLQVPGLADGARLYLAGGDPETPLASPLFADLSGLPPLYIQVGSDEILYSDATRLAERAREAGVAVTDKTYRGLWHLFQVHAGALPVATAAVGELAAFARQCWAVPERVFTKNHF